MRRALAILAVSLITAGCVLLVDAALTLAWKEPASAIYAALRQSEADAELTETEEEFRASLPDAGEPADPARRARRLAGRFERELRSGEAIGRIDGPAASIDYVFVQGTGTAALERGPGHYPGTALPGQGKTVGIAGHRTTYGAPFKQIDEFSEGDEITLEMPYATLTYEVEKTKIVEPSDVQIVRDVGRERLVLTACHPLYSAAQRYAVFGRLVEVSAPEAADAA